MPPRRSRSSLKRKPVDQEKQNTLKQMKQDFDQKIQELMKLYDDVDPDSIFKFPHPLETLYNNDNSDEKSRNKNITLTPIQKAISFCINHNGGSATDEEVLAFIHRFWSTIVSYSLRAETGGNYQYTKPIDMRVLHIKFANLKDNRPLFIKIDENRWKLNDPTASSSTVQKSIKSENKTPENNDNNNNNNDNTDNNYNTNNNDQPAAAPPAAENPKQTQRNSINTRSSTSRNTNANSSTSATSNYGLSTRTSTRSTTNNYSRDSNLFQDKIIEILKNAKNQTLSIDEIISKADEFKDCDGIYANLPFNIRVKCVLEVKKILKEVVYDENTLKWTFQSRPIEKQKNYIPKELKGVRIKELTVNELWNILKEKAIY